MMQPKHDPGLPGFLANPLVILAIGTVGGIVAATAAGFLRKDAKRKREDKDPSNDWLADLEHSLAEAIEKKDIGAIPGLMAKIAAGKK